MNKLTAQEILKIVEENYSESSFAYGNWTDINNNSILTEDQQKSVNDVREAKGNYWSLEAAYILQNLGLGEVEEVDQYGGEGQGETWYSVKYFKDHDVYIRTDGYYQSYNGTDFEEGYGQEVRPIEKTIIVYE